MQRGLVDDGASEDGCAVALVGEAHPVEPGGPSGGEVPLEADFVTSRLVMVVNGCVWLAHGAPSFVAWSHSRQRCGEAASPHVVINVVIPGTGAPGPWLVLTVGVLRKQLELLSAADRRPTA